jgi:valyl-tRNA synthetase
MADAIYHFTWGTFCDWYVELIKGAFDEETKRVAAWAFDQILVMLHPLMPFITEELWNANERPYELIVARWPKPEFKPHPAQAKLDRDLASADVNPPLETQRSFDAAGKYSIEWQIDLISQVRTLRTELNIPWSAVLTPVLIGWNPELMELLEEQSATFGRMAKLGLPDTSEEVPRGSAQIHVKGTIIAFPLEGIIDLDAEKCRLAKAAAAAEKERDSLAARLANPSFVERAKPEAVEKARADHAEKSAEAERHRAALERLG